MRRTISFGVLLAATGMAVIVAAACSVPVDIDWGASSPTPSNTGTATGTATPDVPEPLPGSTSLGVQVPSECASLQSASNVTGALNVTMPPNWIAPFDAYLHQTQSNECSNGGASSGCTGSGFVVASDEVTAVSAPDPSFAGHGEIVRVIAAAGTVLTFDSTVSRTYFTTATESAAQICRVFSFETITINNGGELRAVPWDGAKGGIVVVNTNTLDLQGGFVTADEAGFRGGLDATVAFGSVDISAEGCDAAGGRGEGWAGATPAVCGLKRFASGGGGGTPSDAGGGGGGNAGAGGNGGRIPVSPAGEGRGGAAIYARGSNSLLHFGGGGGAGVSGGKGTNPGGRGGGLIVIVADEITGFGGLISANGEEGGCSSSPTCPGTADFAGGASGGGAGGTIHITTANLRAPVTITADGGDGGDVIGMNSPSGFGGAGGGGGAGRVIGAPASPAGGAAGTLSVGVQNGPAQTGYGPALP